MSAPVTIASVPATHGDRLRIALEKRDGATIVDIRLAKLISQTCGVFSPTKTGVAVELSELPALIAALHAAEAAGLEQNPKGAS